MLIDRLEAMYAKEQGTNILGFFASLLHSTSSLGRRAGRHTANVLPRDDSLGSGHGQ